MLPFYGDVPLIGRVLPARTGCFVLDWLFLMQYARVKVVSWFGNPDSAWCVGNHSCGDDDAPYPDIDDTDDWDFSDVLVDSHVNISATIRLELDAICEFCRFANVAAQQNANVVFSLELQHLNTVKEPDSAVLTKSAPLGRVNVVKVKWITCLAAGILNRSTGLTKPTNYAPRWNVSNKIRWRLPKKCLVWSSCPSIWAWWCPRLNRAARSLLKVRFWECQGCLASSGARGTRHRDQAKLVHKKYCTRDF